MVDRLHYLCSVNKGADQLHGFCASNLCLCFCICIKQVFSRRGSIVRWVKVSVSIRLMADLYRIYAVKRPEQNSHDVFAIVSQCYIVSSHKLYEN